ncbi:IS3 family transposase [Rhizobium glycinendophyticum]|uniref:IS3 family transposase n=1 Tax=Rhizobium glycinendophyticum TaxID=2589807 RepID=A0A504TPJ4_9HYPH|nr:IS3 family transposase [Rhizobium glycinendophyticum]
MACRNNHRRPDLEWHFNGHHNAAAKSFFNLLKQERILRKVYGTCDEALQDVLDYIEMCSNQ